MPNVSRSSKKKDIYVNSSHPPFDLNCIFYWSRTFAPMKCQFFRFFIDSMFQLAEQFKECRSIPCSLLIPRFRNCEMLMFWFNTDLELQLAIKIDKFFYSSLKIPFDRSFPQCPTKTKMNYQNFQYSCRFYQQFVNKNRHSTNYRQDVLSDDASPRQLCRPPEVCWGGEIGAGTRHWRGNLPDKVRQ